MMPGADRNRSTSKCRNWADSTDSHLLAALSSPLIVPSAPSSAPVTRSSRGATSRADPRSGGLDEAVQARRPPPGAGPRGGAVHAARRGRDRRLVLSRPYWGSVGSLVDGASQCLG